MKKLLYLSPIIMLILYFYLSQEKKEKQYTQDREPKQVIGSHNHHHESKKRNVASTNNKVKKTPNPLTENKKQTVDKLPDPSESLTALKKDPDEIEKKLLDIYPEGKFKFSLSKGDEVYRIMNYGRLDLDASNKQDRYKFAQDLSQSFVTSNQFLFIAMEKEDRQVAGNQHREDFMQTCQGIPVYQSYIAIFYNTKSNEIRSSNVNLFDFPCEQIELKISYSNSDGIKVIEKEYPESEVASIKNKTAGGQVVWASSKPAQLAWSYQFRTKQGDVRRAIVSASTGEILFDQSVIIKD